MRYLAKTDDGRTIGEGRTIKTAVDRARKRDGAYVVDDLTGVIQWRKPQAAKPSPLRCADCKWVHEADSTAGTSFRGVELCTVHNRAVNAHAGLVALVRRLDEVSECFDLREDKGRIALAQEINALGHEARAALRAAGEAV